MQRKCKPTQLRAIPSSLLPFVSGGKDDNPSPLPSPVTIYASGGPNGIGGTVVGNVPVGPSTVQPYVTGDSNNGVTGFGVSLIIPFH